MLEVFAGKDELYAAAANLFVELARQAIAERGAFHAALSGGQTPQPVYELLASGPYCNRVCWQKVHIYWTDERCVPAGDNRSNERMVKEAFLDRVPIPPAQIHPVQCGEKPHQAALDYEVLLRRITDGMLPCFDLVFLGLGADGHTASLFPGSSAVTEQTRLVCELYLTEQSLYRVTLTFPVINNARCVAFLVSGQEKAEILRAALTKPPGDPTIPASLVQPHNGKIKWLVDRPAASLVSGLKVKPWHDGNN